MKLQISFSLLLLFTITLYGQGDTVKVLFLGNSYTAANNLPQLVKDVASSAGDVLIQSSNTPGGYTFQMHSTNAQSVGLIQQGGWDYMILQEQSQLPSFPIQQVVNECYPYAKYLDSIFTISNTCGETVFYRTWGRKNGDSDNCPTWPPVCTYAGMDSLLDLRYRTMADSFNGILSPVGNVWRYIRQHYPTIELYSSDLSHPSEAGSYAAACCFYTVLFRKSPSMITYNFNLTVNDALTIRNSVKSVVFDSLTFWNVGNYDPQSSFNSLVQNGYTVNFENTSTNSTSYYWDFGDGSNSIQENPVHTYLLEGDYTVKLISGKCGLSDSSTFILHLDPIAIEEFKARKNILFPNPASSILNIYTQIPGDPETLIELLDVTGRTVMQIKSTGDYIQIINISSIPAGLYIVRLKNCAIDYNYLFIKAKEE